MRYSEHLASLIIRQIGILVAAILLLLTQILPLHAQENPVLRERIQVYSDLVTLGDLFENAGEVASTPVFRSPELGTSGKVAANRVAAAARQHGLEWSNPGEISHVSVRRPGRPVTLEEVRKAIAEKAGGEGEEWLVEFSRGSKPYQIDARIDGPITVKHMHVQQGTGIFRAVITARTGDHTAKEKIFTGRAFPSVEAVVPAHAISRGSIIQEDDLKVIRLPKSRVANTAIEDKSAAIGMAAKQRLNVGRAVLQTDIELPKLVQRNAFVTIVYKVPGMVLKAKGKALADGAKGEMIQIENLQSKRTIEAQVSGTGLVSVTGETASRPQPNPRRTARSVPRSASGKNTYVIR